ncbi:MAG: PD-(D/E)XK nuclease family protein [Desulfuromonadales bacterium]|nr:PD-(D/E)XK nuclease family protein [Desulfuromonadales bacterium]
MTNDPLDIAAAGGTVLTANKRLARQLVRQFDQRQVAAGLAVWPSPAILSLSAWVTRQLHLLRRESSLLTDGQLQRSWELVIAADAASVKRDLLQLPQTAGRAREAQLLLESYRADFTSMDGDEDAAAFLRWRSLWQERAGREGWLDRGSALRVVTAAVVDGTLRVPPQLVLAGFDDLTPATAELCRSLTARGCTVSSWDAEPVAAVIPPAVWPCPDPAEEVRACACWARALLTAQPQATIGVVVPQLNDYQSLIERIFRTEFDPSGCLAGDDGPEPFTLSLGTPLAREGVVSAALRLLAIADPLRIEELGWLLRSPYLSGAVHEWAARACADRELRRRGRSSWPLAALQRALRRLPGVSRMADVIAAISAERHDRRRRLPGEWSEQFALLLEACGWPGGRGLHSREFQAVRHVKDLLGQLAALDRVSSPISRGEALALLQRLATAAVFQPEGAETRVQVLGMLEASGFTFDALWILGLHEGALPAPPRPNPFIPLALQSRLHMPHADALREGEFAAKVSRRLFAAAPTVILSWPRQVDGGPQRPSPLLRGLSAAALPPLISVDPARVISSGSAPLEIMDDAMATPLTTRKPFAGGTGILKDQALCPFRAFAHHRLRARQLDAPDVGLDEMARGSLIHVALEKFWQDVRSQAELRGLSHEELAGRLQACAEQAIARLERERRCDIPPRQRQLELTRLIGLTREWLVEEVQRSPFEIVEIEKQHVETLGRLTITTRVDRIDRLADGRVAVIDYKTGSAQVAQWCDERLTEPQLPIYCVGAGAESVGAVLFAVVRSRRKERGFRGLAATEGLWPAPEKALQKLLAERGWANFSELCAHWRTTLTTLGDAFANGVATVDPVERRKTCRYCDLVPLCRILESGPAGGTGEGDNGL